MKKNIYTDGISKINVSDELLNKCIENIRESEVTDEVISFEKAKSKHRWFKPVGAVAATLAVIIGLGSVGVFKEDESTKNPFILTVNAEELSNETYIHIGELECNGQNSRALFMAEDVGEALLQEIGASFDFNVQCVGENIESVTYTSEHGVLSVIYDYEGLIDYVPPTMDEMLDGREPSTYRGFYKRVNSCTLDYDMQPYGGPDPIKPEEYKEKIPLMVYFQLSDFDDNCRYDLNDENFSPDEIFIDKFNNSEEKYSVDVTANYTDGSTLTKRLQFKCEKIENEENICLSAIVIDNPQ